MDYTLQTVLQLINEPFYCKINRNMYEYENGPTAIKALQGVNRQYAVISISASESGLVVTLHDQTQEIKEQNELFSKEYKEQNGHEPGFF